MKILFVLQHPGYVRNYESLIRELAIREHEIQLGFNSLKKQKPEDVLLVERLVESFGNIVCLSETLPSRHGVLRRFLYGIRGAVDYIRFLTPAYKNAYALRERLEKRFPKVFVVLVRNFCRLLPSHGNAFVDGLFRKLELAIPTDPGINRFLISSRPDVLLVTPYTDFASVQTDYVKSARFLQIRCGVCVHSWDNLSNKGLIRILPDRVFVWNKAQKNEAVEMHKVPPDQIVVTGAQCFDKWFDRRPSVSSDEFTNKIGLKLASTPLVLYVCSSPFIAPKEVHFVRSWLKSIRKDNLLSQARILIRPHPQNAAQWADVDLSEYGDVSIWPKAGANPIGEEAKSDFYDSMYYCDAVIGVNTSAMIEAGILGKTVLTVLADDFKGTQEGTLHFHHLVNGGLLRVAKNLEEHRSQLAQVLIGGSEAKKEVENFIHSFVRPLGLNGACTPILADAVEDISSIAPLPFLLPPWWSGLIRAPIWILDCLVKVPQLAICKVRRLGRIRRSFNKARIIKSVHKLKRAVFLKLTGLARYLEVDEAACRFFSAIRIIRYGTQANQTAVIACRSELARIASGKQPVLLGPWVSEVGFEVLYWIPFLRWVAEEYDLDNSRLIAMSRGGAHPWYEGLTSRYIDILEFFTPEQFRQKNEERIRITGGQKHNLISALDLELLSRAKSTLQVESLDWIHPKLMYDLFSDYWRRRVSVSLIESHTRYEQYMALPERKDIQLPDEFVAVKFYFSAAFPDNQENRSFAKKTIERLACKTHVVVLDTGLKLDDHDDSNTVFSDRIISFSDKMTPSDNLAVQTYIISRSRAFLGTYGGFSYLPPLIGVPSYSFYSSAGKFLPVHLDVAHRACRVIQHGAFDKLSKNDKKLAESIVEFRGSPEFHAINTTAFETLESLL